MIGVDDELAEGVPVGAHADLAGEVGVGDDTGDTDVMGGGEGSPPMGLSVVEEYDPATDLIPLCPNCHRAVHTRRPVPWTPANLADRFVHE